MVKNQTPYLPETLRRLKQNLVHTMRPHPTETDPDLPLGVRVSPAEVQVISGLLQGQGLWVQQTSVWHKPSWRRSPLTPPYSYQDLHRNGETGSWRAQTKPFVHQDPGERRNDPTRNWPRLAHECPGVSGGGMGQWWRPSTGSGALSAVPFEGGRHYLYYFHHGLTSDQTTGREHSSTINRKLD